MSTRQWPTGRTRESFLLRNLTRVETNTQDDVDPCPICYEPYDKSISSTTNHHAVRISNFPGACGHTFGSKCIERYILMNEGWRRNRKMCPLCRGPLCEDRLVMIRPPTTRPTHLTLLRREEWRRAWERRGREWNLEREIERLREEDREQEQDVAAQAEVLLGQVEEEEEEYQREPTEEERARDVQLAQAEALLAQVEGDSESQQSSREEPQGESQRADPRDVQAQLAEAVVVMELEDLQEDVRHMAAALRDMVEDEDEDEALEELDLEHLEGLRREVREIAQLLREMVERAERLRDEAMARLESGL